MIPMLPEKDISNRDDLDLLMRIFYDKLLGDPSINYFFTQVAGIDITTHIPVLVDFWETVLFNTGTYTKNAIQPHMALHHQSPITREHFATWLKYFKETVDGLFVGEKAILAKQRAESIATVMQIKIKQLG
jgi:hemoglobin